MKYLPLESLTLVSIINIIISGHYKCSVFVDKYFKKFEQELTLKFVIIFNRCGFI